MTERAEGTSPRLEARIAGGLYLIVIIAGSFALYARSGLIVRGDAAATAAKLVASEPLFRLSIVALLAIAGVAWLTGSVASILSPPLAVSLAPYTVAVGGLGETVFTLWLLVMGVNAARWREHAAMG